MGAIATSRRIARPAACALLAAAALLMGWCIWRAFVHQPPATYGFAFGAVGRVTHPSGAPQAYFRKTVFVASPVRHGWIAISARDSYVLYVNGRPVAARQFVSIQVGGLHDITPYLLQGKNVIAVVSRRRSFPGPADLVAEGLVHETAGTTQRIGSDSTWRVSDVEPRTWGASSWHSPRIDDSTWMAAAAGDLTPATRDIRVPVLPEAITLPWKAQWLAHGPNDASGSTSTWTIEPPLQGAALRLSSPPGYVALLNGTSIVPAELLDRVDEALLAAEKTGVARSAERWHSHVYDVSALVHAGTNTLTLLPGASDPLTARLRAELVIREPNGGAAVYAANPGLGEAGRTVGPGAVPVAPPPGGADGPDALQPRARESTVTGALQAAAALAACLLAAAAVLAAGTTAAARALVNSHASAAPWAFDAAAACSVVVSLPLMVTLLASFDVRVDPALPYFPALLLVVALAWAACLLGLTRSWRRLPLPAARSVA